MLMLCDKTIEQSHADCKALMDLKFKHPFIWENLFLQAIFTDSIEFYFSVSHAIEAFRKMIHSNRVYKESILTNTPFVQPCSMFSVKKIFKNVGSFNYERNFEIRAHYKDKDYIRMEPCIKGCDCPCREVSLIAETLEEFQELLIVYTFFITELADALGNVLRNTRWARLIKSLLNSVNEELKIREQFRRFYPESDFDDKQFIRYHFLEKNLLELDPKFITSNNCWFYYSSDSVHFVLPRSYVQYFFYNKWDPETKEEMMAKTYQFIFEADDIPLDQITILIEKSTPFHFINSLVERPCPVY